MTTHRHSAVPNDGPDNEADQGAYPTGHRRTTIPTARQTDQDPEGRTTLTVSKRNGTIVLDRGTYGGGQWARSVGSVLAPQSRIARRSPGVGW